MMILITYDVSTETREGRRRLRRVAKTCLNYGQRVQKSVFECQVNTMEMARLKDQLLNEIDEAQDSLRIYRIIEPLRKTVKNLAIAKRSILKTHSLYKA